MPPFQQTPKMPGKPILVYVGTFTNARGKGKGIYAYWLQTSGMEVSQNITLVPLGLAVETSNPSFLEVDVKRRLVFSVNQDTPGAISAFSVDAGGKLKLINQRPSMGVRPCHIALDKDGKN